MDEGLRPERPGRRHQTRHDEGELDLPRREGYGLEEGPDKTEGKRYREHLSEGEPGGVMCAALAGEERYVQTQSSGAEQGQ